MLPAIEAIKDALGKRCVMLHHASIRSYKGSPCLIICRSDERNFIVSAKAATPDLITDLINWWDHSSSSEWRFS
jgi:hypothetical protein